MSVREVTREVRMNHWVGIMRAQKDSGLNITTWCKENGIKEQKYYYWQRKLREGACESLITQKCNTAVTPVTFAEVSSAPEPVLTGAIILRTGEIVVEVSADASPAAIEAFMRGLYGR